jgi:hypothetical protein
VFPVEVVATKMEQDLVTDEAWRTHGERLPAPEIDEGERIAEIADTLERRVQHERDLEAVDVGAAAC